MVIEGRVMLTDALKALLRIPKNEVIN